MLKTMTSYLSQWDTNNYNAIPSLEFNLQMSQIELDPRKWSHILITAHFKWVLHSRPHNPSSVLGNLVLVRTSHLTWVVISK